jgi:hypothetical protein
MPYSEARGGAVQAVDDARLGIKGDTREIVAQLDDELRGLDVGRHHRDRYQVGEKVRGNRLL